MQRRVCDILGFELLGFQRHKDGNYVFAQGNTVPTDGTTGYKHGCIFVHLDGSGSNDGVYQNIGTSSSCDFDPLVDSAAAGGTLDAAFDLGKVIDGADSRANAVQIGDGTNALELYELAGTLYIGSTNAGGANLTIVPDGGTVAMSALCAITPSGTPSTPSLTVTRNNSATNGHGIELAMGTAAIAGNAVDVTFGAGASTGNGLDLDMGAQNVTGMAINIASAATGTATEGSALNVAHTGNLGANSDLIRVVSTGSPSSTSAIVAFEQSTGAGTAGAYLCYMSATGTNVEALHVDDGNVVIDEDLTVSGTATLGTIAISAVAPSSGNLTINAATGANTVTIGNLSTGGIVISDNMTVGQPILMSTTTEINFHDADLKIYASTDGQLDIDGDTEIEVAAPTIDIDGATAVNIDGATISIDGTATSNLTVTGADLRLYTATSGDIDINSAADFLVDATTVFSIDGVGASNVTTDSGNLTLSTTTSGNVIITAAGILDVDCVGNSHIVTDSGNMNIQTTTSGDIDINSVAALDVDCVALDITNTGAMTWASSGGAFAITSTSQNLSLITATSGNIILTSAGILDIDGVGNSHVIVDSGNLNLQTTTSGDVDINSVAALDLDCVALTIDNTGACTWASSGGAWSLTSDSQNVSLITTTSGDIILTGAGALDADVTGNSHIITDSGGMNIQTTTSGDIDINSVATLDVDCVALEITNTGAVTWASSGGAFSLTSTSQNLTIQTATSGDLAITSAAAFALTAPASTAVVVNSVLNCTSDGMATQVVAGAVGDGNFDVDLDGNFAIDSSNGRWYFRYGAAWHYCSQDAGFQIPKDEVKCPKCGKKMKTGQRVVGRIDKIMKDKALHGLYEHEECPKGR